MNKLENHPLAKEVNVIVTADHGMENISEEKIVFLNDILKPEWIAYAVGGNPIYNIKANEGYKDSILTVLNSTEGLMCYTNPNLPEYLNYGSNPRCLDFTVVADSSWSIMKKHRKHYGKGTHGYDIRNKNMNAMFYAYGPAFKSGYKQPMFKNTDVYPLMCQVLGLTPAPNDGDYIEVHGMLK
jgi:alkaline phosphatase D